MNQLKYITLGIIAIVLASCGTKVQEDKQEKNDFSKEFLSNVETDQVVLRNIEQQLKLTGKVEYDPDRIVQYIPLVSGVVESVHFNLGDKVTKGQVMMFVKSAELSALYAEKQSLEAEINILNRNMESVSSMYKDNLTSQKEMVEAQERLKQANAELKKADVSLSPYGLPDAEGNFGIKAPISGFVTGRNIAQGTQIAAGNETPAFIIADVSKVWITANVYAGDLAFVKQGIPVDITTMAYPGEVFYGKIDMLPQVFDSEEHVLKARIIVPNSDLKFKPEMAVDLTLKESREVKVASLPSDALIFDNDRYFAVKREGEHFVIKEVKVYTQTGGISYLESGVNPGDEVVVKNQLLMYSHLKGNA